jgi:CCR4-NOT transcriptional regulation complex NOT5 subunit
MKIIYNKFLIISTIALFMGGVYLYFSNDLSSKDIVPVAFGSSLTSSNGSTSAEAAEVSQGEKISSDVSFLSTLVGLKKIKIDTALFANKSFNRLENNAVQIEKVTAGRKNPFAPIGTGVSSSSGSASTSTSKVVTDQPTQITDKTVVFNGTINTTSGVTDIYFEYGTTTDLGTLTALVKQSLVGTFIKNILDLTPKTNYFYRACAKINNVVNCGDVVPFTTN